MEDQLEFDFMKDYRPNLKKRDDFNDWLESWCFRYGYDREAERKLGWEIWEAYNGNARAGAFSRNDKRCY